MLRAQDQDTICAVSTPAGVGGLAVIRVSGKSSVEVFRKLAPFFPAQPESHRAYYGVCYRASAPQEKDEIDEVIATYFKSGRSFTGEATLEISCHGSPQITRIFLDELVRAGCRIAERGEFTYRAFMNGRIDLVQAESVLALIESQSESSSRQALRQLQGNLSKQLNAQEDSLIWCLAHLEASIDFSTEGIEVVAPDDLIQRTSVVKESLRTLVQSFRSGRIINDGYRLVLAGAPNVGKSSLLNLLIGEDKAIVTDVAGTTRDLIEASFFTDGIKINLVDTAGLRESEDRVEQIGIEKSYKAQKEADGIFYLFDAALGLTVNDVAVLDELSPENVFLIGNKIDLVSEEETALADVERTLSGSKFLQKIQDTQTFWKQRVFFTSALNHKEADRLKQVIAKDLQEQEYADQAVIFQARHFESLNRALENVIRAEELIHRQAGAEFIALELKESLLLLQETLGKRFDDQIMDRVFKEFCIGK